MIVLKVVMTPYFGCLNLLGGITTSWGGSLPPPGNPPEPPGPPGAFGGSFLGRLVYDEKTFDWLAGNVLFPCPLIVVLLMLLLCANDWGIWFGVGRGVLAPTLTVLPLTE